MNSKAALLLILCAVVIATFLYSGRISEKDNDMDRLAKGLEGIEAHLKPGSCILSENKTHNVDLSFRVRYLLAPHIVNMTGTNDTVLSISEKNDLKAPDSTRKILWTNTDSLYHYSLTHTR